MELQKNKTVSILQKIALAFISMYSLILFIAAFFVVIMGAKDKDFTIILVGIAVFILFLAFLTLFILKMIEIKKISEEAKKALFNTGAWLSFGLAILIALIVLGLIIGSIFVKDDILVIMATSCVALAIPLAASATNFICCRIIVREQMPTKPISNSELTVKLPKKISRCTAVLIVLTSVLSATFIAASALFAYFMLQPPSRWNTETAIEYTPEISYHNYYDYVSDTYIEFYRFDINTYNLTRKEMQITLRATVLTESTTVEIDKVLMVTPSEYNYYLRGTYFEFQSEPSDVWVEIISVSYSLDGVNFTEISTYSMDMVIWSKPKIITFIFMLTSGLLLLCTVMIWIIQIKRKIKKQAN